MTTLKLLKEALDPRHKEISHYNVDGSHITVPTYRMDPDTQKAVKYDHTEVIRNHMPDAKKISKASDKFAQSRLTAHLRV